jgi:hypothetical protein
MDQQGPGSWVRDEMTYFLLHRNNYIYFNLVWLICGKLLPSTVISDFTSLGNDIPAEHISINEFKISIIARERVNVSIVTRMIGLFIFQAATERWQSVPILLYTSMRELTTGSPRSQECDWLI